jgi:hypothetical protein
MTQRQMHVETKRIEETAVKFPEISLGFQLLNEIFLFMEELFLKILHTFPWRRVHYSETRSTYSYSTYSLILDNWEKEDIKMSSDNRD